MTRIEKMARAAGLETKAYLTALLDEHRKTTVIALVTGVTEHAIYREVRRHEIELPKIGSFELDGVMDNLEGHCKRLNVSVQAVRGRKHRYKVTSTEAIRGQIENDQKFKRGRFKA